MYIPIASKQWLLPSETAFCVLMSKWWSPPSMSADSHDMNGSVLPLWCHYTNCIASVVSNPRKTFKSSFFFERWGGGVLGNPSSVIVWQVGHVSFWISREKVSFFKHFMGLHGLMKQKGVFLLKHLRDFTQYGLILHNRVS